VSRVVALLNEETRAVKASRILLLGLAYKPGTSDWRESPATTVAQHLHTLGADVRAHDAYVPLDADLGVPVTRVSCERAELAAADLVILLVDHPDLPYEQIASHSHLVLDTRGRFAPGTFTGERL
jgi:UDP-N-acetyl-D-mannosaminuronate dehydrogenase